MTWLAIPAFLKRIPWQVFAVLALLLALWLWGNHRHSEGVKAERERWEQKIAADKAAQAERERQASIGLRKREAEDRAAAEQRKLEIDHATRDIPDQGLTPRQRARAELELRRQAEAERRNQRAP